MNELFWKLFEKSGSIDAFMAYREYTEHSLSSGACAQADNNACIQSDERIY